MPDSTEQDIYKIFVNKKVIVRYNTEEGQRIAKGILTQSDGKKLLIMGEYNQWILNGEAVIDMNLLR